MYDIPTDTWTVSEIKLEKRAGHNLNYYKNKLYISGGTRLSRNGKFEYLNNKIEVVDLVEDTLMIDEANPHSAAHAASFVYGSNIIFIGGSTSLKKNGKKEFLGKVHQFNLESGLWYEIGAMPVAKEVQGILIDDKIFIVGGFQNEPVNGIESFDLTTGRWKKEAELPPSYENPAVTSDGKMIYFFEDGKIGSYHTQEKILQEYEIEINVKGAKLHYANNKLYILGGYGENIYSIKPSGNCYSIELNEFQFTEVKNRTTFAL